MSKPDKSAYDVVIIGAGISGLVCGCYLAKSGMKVLIAEQHSKPGGYCTSFKRNGFTFDAAAHSFGGVKYGLVGRILTELAVDKRLEILRVDPTDIIVTLRNRITFWQDLDHTIEGCKKQFPGETGIGKFLTFLLDPDINTFPRMRHWTFQDLLDQYLSDRRIKALLSFPLYGNSGLPPSRLSAFIGAKIYKEFLLDGGYYPSSSMQSMADAFAMVLKEQGGELRLSTRVERIDMRENKVQGVIVESGEFIPSRCIVSNADARQTFFNLIGEQHIDPELQTRLRHMEPSLSMFILYLGLNSEAHALPDAGANIWALLNDDIEMTYRAACYGNYREVAGCLMRIAPDRKTMNAFINIAFQTREFWDHHRNSAADILTEHISRIYPRIAQCISYSGTATPQTLFRYTSNYQGAAYGWSGTPDQLTLPDLRKPSVIRGLYLTGHWTTHGLGIPGVMYIGYDTANMISRTIKNL